MNMLKRDSRVYFIGIKGTGMCALAELMSGCGFRVSGSDREETFYTDIILKELGIPYHESFDASHIRAENNELPDLVIYSAAYSADTSAETNVEIAEAIRLGIPVYKYTDALGLYSAGFDSTGITGVHGKTTTTSITATLIRALGLPAQVLVGSAVSGFGGRSTLNLGNKYFVAETCEYRRHFLAFHPQRIILTNVESDHQDCFPEYKDIRDAFLEYGKRLPQGGQLVYCADDCGASEVAGALISERPDITLVPYGFSAQGDHQIQSYQVKDERVIINLRGFPGDLKLRIPGRHTALNAAAATALVSLLVKKEFGSENSDGWNNERREALRKALEDFSGSRRRTEILGEAGGILFMDDYGHHPTEIKTTLAGLKEFYPRRRLVLSFMSHTYTRTAALLEEFASSFKDADLILLHKIYSSAREPNREGLTGRVLFEKARENSGRRDHFFYEKEPEDADELLKTLLKSGDLFITMGAGDNWKLGKKLFEFYQKQET